MYYDPDDESPRSEINDQLVSLCQSVAESALSGELRWKVVLWGVTVSSNVLLCVIASV